MSNNLLKQLREKIKSDDSEPDLELYSRIEQYLREHENDMEIDEIDALELRNAELSQSVQAAIKRLDNVALILRQLIRE